MENRKKNLILFAIAFVPTIVTGMLMNTNSKQYSLIINSQRSELIKLRKSNKKLNKTNTKYVNAINTATDTGNSSINTSKTKSFFETIYNYTNDNYVSRFDSAKQYASDDVVAEVMPNGSLETPKTTIDSKLIDFEFYNNPSANVVNGNSGIAVVKVNLTYQGQVQHIVYEYDVQLKDDGQIQHLVQRIIDNSANGSNNEEQ